MNLSKKVLIVSSLFAPQNQIGAVRPSKIAKYLVRNGFELTVLCCESRENLRDETLICEELRTARIEYISHGKHYLRLTKMIEKYLARKQRANIFSLVNRHDNITKKLHGIPISASIRTKEWIYFILNILGSLSWSRQCNIWIKNNTNQDQYDLIFSTFGPYSSHWVANYIKRKKIARIWIADFRDSMVPEKLPKLAKWFASRWQRGVGFKADGLTAVSAGVMENVLSTAPGSIVSCRIISNGYDMDDISISHVIDLKKIDNHISFGYTGALYNGRRDLTPLFRALRELVDERSVPESAIMFHYAGDEVENLKSQAAEYLMDLNIINHGILSRQEAMRLQSTCDVLVVASWNTRSEQGVLTGKFFEYILAGNPVVALVAGDVPDSEIAMIVRECNLGIVYEQVNAEQSLIALKDYITFQYQSIKNGTEIYYNPDKTKLDNYNYSNLTQTFIDFYRMLH